MNTPQFNSIVDERLAKIKEVLQQKALEYQGGNMDRMHNFKRCAMVTGMSPERCLMGYFLKHFISLLDMIDALDSGSNPKNVTIDEKLGDIINYMILLEALLKERNFTYLK